uniref:RNA-dependent RNA polymerase n=1 Tax=Ditylenchus dipsaci TaxID=166011 RepID=A0A915E7I7_9BILA
MEQNFSTENFKLIFKLDEKKIAAAGNEQLQNEYSQQLALDLRNLVTNVLFNDTYDQDEGYSYKNGNLFLEVELITIHGGQLTEKEEDRRVEFLICATHQRLREVSVSVMQDIMDGLGKYVHPELVYFLVAEKPDLFLNNYNAYDSGLALQSIKFCNILDHTRLLCHRTTEAFNQAELNKLPTPTTPDDENGYKVSRTGMLAKCEHDLRKLSVTFSYIRTYKTAVDLIKLEIDYSSVQQLFTDFDGKHYQLLLRLKNPPIIRRTSNVITFPTESYNRKPFVPNIDPSALPNDQKKNNKERRNWVTHVGERCTSWNDKETNLAYDINNSPIFCLCFDTLEERRWAQLIGRLKSCLKMPIEMRRFQMEKPPINTFVMSKINALLIRLSIESFDLLYILRALFSRGNQFLDHLNEGSTRERFFHLVLEGYTTCKIVTMQVLEHMLLLLDEQLEFPNPAFLFEKLFNETSVVHVNSEMDDGYIFIRKMMITPSRILLLAPEMLMSNRVLRYDQEKYPADSFVRVIFRDDDWQKVHPNNVTYKLANEFIGDRLKRGECIAGGNFNFIGASNSQLRDGGCYFLKENIENITKFRQELGSFSTTSIPKMMSRLGQCFTQASESSVDMTSQILVEDFTGGCDRNGKPYIFSDGCGCMSLQAASQIAFDLGLEHPPSCVQIRCGADEKPINFVFRKSQLKFGTNEDIVNKLEIVKYSSPTPVCLNKPLINILDQVSRLQSFESHARINNRIKTLLEKHMFELCGTLTNEEAARNKLIAYSKLDCFNLTEEPFFKLLLRASAKLSIHKLRQKSSIQIPASCGRVMFGVVDTTETLQSNQVFVQYTNNVNNKNPSKKSFKTVVTGPVMMTKNPCIVAGDVRLFEAVDIPALRSLHDVVVFPRYGVRPHPDEMAGSDLDGDEYVVTWDRELMIHHNEPAFDYTSDSVEVVSENIKDFQDKMADFVVDSIKNDSLGQLANAFLAVSDLYGIESDVCEGIAKKHSQAVDFVKTGIKADSLEKKWIDDVPPEKFERAPDFMEKDHEPCYVSPRLNGQLYRYIKQMSEHITNAIDDEENCVPEVDQSLIELNYQEYLDEAAEHYQEYSNSILRLMKRYGIKCEGELFSGSFSALRNRLSDRENDDMSFFNTTKMIEQQLLSIFATARQRFFGGPEEMSLVTVEKRFPPNNPYKNICQRTCPDPSTELKSWQAPIMYFLMDNRNVNCCLFLG